MFENILDIQITSCDRPMDAVDIACGIGAVEVAGGVLLVLAEDGVVALLIHLLQILLGGRGRRDR